MHYPVTTLEEAFQVLEPKGALLPEQIEPLFVRREGSDIDQIQTRLRSARQPHKLLFVGHRGSGKSTELTYLATKLGDDFLPVNVPLYSIYHSTAVEPAEVVLGIYVRMLLLLTNKQVVDKGLVAQFWEDALKVPFEWLRSTLFGEHPNFKTIPPKVTVEFAATFAKALAEFETRIGLEGVTRAETATKLDKQLASMSAHIELMAAQVRLKLKKRVCVFVEDGDKLDYSSALALFRDAAGTLTEPPVPIVYSFPVALRYSNEFPLLRASYSGTYHLPNLSLRHRDGTRDDSGWAAARDVIRRRVAPAVIPDNTLDAAISCTGGVVRDLIQLLQEAVTAALTDRAKQVTPEHVRFWAQRLRDDYIPILTPNQRVVLRAFRESKDKDLSDIDAERAALLRNGSLLEYRNTRGPWGDVHPLVAELLDRAP